MGRDISKLHPRLQDKANELIKLCKDNGIAIKIGECYRTVAEQNELYAQGRTKPGNIVTNAKGTSYSSQHQWGIAFDFFLDMDIDGDGKKSDDAFNNKKSTFNKVGKLGKSIGLGWGGDWKSPVDLPHFYLPDWGKTTSELKKKYGTPSEFKETWDDKVQKEKKKYSGEFPTLPSRGYYKLGDGYKTLTNFKTQIKRLQKFLNWCIGTKLTIDGEYGAKTKDAVVAFQKKYGLSVDGEFGKNSLAKAKSIKK